MGFYSFFKNYKKKFVNSLLKSDYNESTKEDFHQSKSGGVEIQVPYQTYASSLLVVFDQSPTNLNLNEFNSIFLSKGINPRRKSFSHNFDMKKPEFIQLLSHSLKSSLRDEPLTKEVKKLSQKNAVNVNGEWASLAHLDFRLFN